MRVLRIHQNPDTEVVTIEGIRYHMDLFRAMANYEIGSIIRIDKRENDGVLYLSKLLDGEIVNGVFTAKK